MRKIRIITVFVLPLLLIPFISGCSTDKEGVAAIVNGEEISVDEYNKEYEIYKALFIYQNGEDALYKKTSDGKTYEDTLKRDVYDKIILEKIIEQDFNKSGLSIDSKELEEYIDESLGEVKDEFGDFIEKIGMSWEDAKRMQNAELMVNKHRDHYAETLSISESEIKEYYNKYKDDLIKYRLSQIYLDDEQKANELLDRLKKGEKFEEIAKIESKDSISAVNGGDIGYIKKGENLLLDEYVKELEVGEFSEVINASNGFYIIKLTDVKESLNDLKDDVIKEIKDKKYIEYLSELRDKAKIKDYYDDIE
ncbi:MAG TPA: peptidylprolyl isomerase [Soehngenia sp.]|nr:peptidylprolyl isomerase [Soehngenia sp.]HPP31550.1 peptidylprolyl isomerase [Soehngenia sp.]